MGFVLTVYFKDSVKEIFLPGVNNKAICETIEKEISGLDYDLNINLDVFEHEWHIRENKDLRFKLGDNVQLMDGLRLEAMIVKSQTILVILVDAYYRGLTEFKKYVFGGTKIEIGAGNLNQIHYNLQNYISEKHAYMEKNSISGAVLTDCRSKNGTYLNGRRIKGDTALQYGDIIFIFGLKIVYLGDVIAVNSPKGGSFEVQSLMTVPREDLSSESESSPVNEYYQRSPRKILQVDNETIEIEAPPQPLQRRRTPLWMTIGPSFSMILPMLAGILFTMYSANKGGTMTSPFMFMGIITSGTAALIGVFWALNNYRFQNKAEKEDEKRREEKYKKYLEETERILQQKHDKNRKILSHMYPEIHECLGWVMKKETHIWEKNINHPDFLEVRLGIGSCISPNQIIVPKSRFTLVDDKLAEQPFNIQRLYQFLTGVPVSISLYEHNLIGVIGNRKNIYEIARIMAMQTAILHSYADVKLVFIYNKQESWDFVKWLPHTWSPNESIRMVANDSVGVGEIFYYLSGVIRDRLNSEEMQAQGSQVNPKKLNRPHYIIFISDPSLVENEPIMKYLTSQEANIGITTILLYEKIDRLPNDCTVIIQKDDKYNGFYSLNNSFQSMENVAFDMLPENQADEVARVISRYNVKEAEGSGAVPQMLTFLDMYKTNNPETINIYRNWLENHTYESMKALIGHRGGGTPLYLDIHEKYHGPHGLVAGTTGSGKSEMLQTYILSLALTYHPYEVSFILIDYKGGGMAKSFEGMPHVSGIITNLGGNQTKRALASIKSEVKRRQAMFNKHGVKHIDNYIELYRNAKQDDLIIESGPIPHLIIIADEFAELKKEQSEFVNELVSVSRVGRSLGVHLILATQKPDGVVDEQMWSNTKFRICLRVASPQDSRAMLKRNEAAYITNSGRGYFQVGNDEIFEEFQSGWSGAQYEPDVPFSDEKNNEVKMINLWGKLCVVRSKKQKNKKSDQSEAEEIKKTEELIKQIQLNAVVKYMSDIFEEKGIEPIDCVWMPPLPNPNKRPVYLKDLPEYGNSGEEWVLDPVVGLIDDPENQEQRTLRLNFTQDGHMIICGSSGGGKTTFLQTLIYSLITTKKPSKLNIYIADFGSRILGNFHKAPHVGDFVYDDNEDKTNKLISMIIKELAGRKLRFSQKGVGTFKDYMQLDKPDECPAILFVIDNYSSFIDNNPKQEDNILLLAKEAASYGIYLVISCSNLSDIRGKIRQQITAGIGLQLSDRIEYSDVLGVRSEITAEENCPGRGIVKSMKATEENPNPQAMPLEFQTAVCIESETLSKDLDKEFDNLINKYSGFKAPKVPQIPENMTYEAFKISPEAISAKNAGLIPIGYNMEDAQLVGINFTRTFGFIIGGGVRTGKTNAFKVILSECSDANYDVYFIDTIDKRMASAVKEVSVSKYIAGQEEIFNFFAEILKPEFKRRNSLIEKAGGRKFADKAMESEKNMIIFIHDFGEFLQTIYGDKRLYPFIEQMMRMGDSHKISIVACITKEDAGMHSAKPAYNSFVSWKEGVYFGGAVDNQRIFEFDMLSSERIKKLVAGQGHIMKNGRTAKIITPVI